MKDQAQIVVIGGGIYGAQVAYHLAKNGRKDVVIIEKGEVASGELSCGWVGDAVCHIPGHVEVPHVQH